MFPPKNHSFKDIHITLHFPLKNKHLTMTLTDQHVLKYCFNFIFLYTALINFTED